MPGTLTHYDADILFRLEGPRSRVSARAREPLAMAAPFGVVRSSGVVGPDEKHAPLPSLVLSTWSWYIVCAGIQR